MFDLVHDVAGAYRRLVKASSYPGDILSVAEFSKSNSIESPFYDHTLLMAFMLLDSEVAFAVVGKEADQAADMIERLTYAKRSKTQEADFIFILRDAVHVDIDEALEAAKKGDLIDPHKSATLIIEVESLTRGNDYMVHGPGIEHKKRIRLGLTERWVKLRGSKNEEYPMGIELYFVDEEGDMMALPRTTQIEGWAQ